MKKLLVLALVLSMATMANAGLVVSVSGPATLATNAVGTYTVSYTCSGLNNNNLVASDMDIVVDLGGIGGGVVVTTNVDTGLSYMGINSGTGNYESSLTNDVGDSDMGSPLFTFKLTAPASPGTAHVQLLENSFFDTDWNQITGGDLTLNGETVVVTPEPITVALLGLGGLFLRRRK